MKKLLLILISVLSMSFMVVIPKEIAESYAAKKALKYFYNSGDDIDVNKLIKLTKIMQKWDEDHPCGCGRKKFLNTLTK